jgi:hypothetical protein
MEDRLRLESNPGRPDAAEVRRIQAALRQLEWADTYLNAVTTLDLEDHESRLALAEIRRRLTGLELRLRRLGAA